MAYANYWNRTEETAMNFGLIAPSLTPTSALVSSLCPIIGPNTRITLDGNPAFTVYDVDPDTYDIMDRKVYIGKRITTNHTRTRSLKQNKNTPANLTDPHFQTKRTPHYLPLAKLLQLTTVYPE